MSAAQAWTPYNSLTIPPTNLKEAIDWVLRVTGRDGKKNDKAAASPPQFSCLCFLAKAVKDLLYDARSPGSPGPHPDRYWDDILLEQEESIVKPVLTDLGLLNGGSTSAASTTCAGGTEVIKALIDQLAQGLQKWVGWKDTGDDCCLKGEGGGGAKESKGIGRKCECPGTGGGSNCCNSGSGTPCHECSHCGTSSAATKCYQSAYSKATSPPSGGGASTEGEYYWPTLSDKPDHVHLLARIFLGTVCLIWSGLSQLGFLTGGSGSGNDRWNQKGKLHEVGNGLGSFMAAMGYDLERLNQGTGNTGKTGSDVAEMLKGGFSYFGDGADKNSVAEYYSSIYSGAKTALTGQKTEEICTKYPLLVLHILASGYFRAGSAGAKGVTTPPKAATSTTSDTPSSRKPRTIREILYWLSALPYSQGYRALVERMKEKYPRKEKNPQETENTIVLHGEKSDKTELKKDCITHYLMAACGYCPLVLIGIQGTIATSGTDPAAGPAAGAGADKKKCPEHKKDPNAKRCIYDDKKAQEAAKPAPAPAGSDGKLKEGQVCYGGYHLAVKDFGPLHGMYANGLFGFQMDISPAQCLDQLRVYVYHCFYQLYFLRKQCKVAVLGWQSCRYGKGVSGTGTDKWICQGNGDDHTKNCGLRDSGGSKDSPLMSFLCDTLKKMHCPTTTASSVRNYQEIKDHMEAKDVVGLKHFGDPPIHCPVPMGWQAESTSTNSENHFKDLNNGSHKKADLTGGTGQQQKYPAHCTGNTLSHLLEYYCDPEKCPSGTLVVLLRLLACITPTVPRTLGDLFGFYYYIVYIGGNSSGGAKQGDTVYGKLTKELKDVRLRMQSNSDVYSVVGSLTRWSGDCTRGSCKDTLKCLYGDAQNAGQCSQYLCPLSGQQYGQLSPAMAGTYLSWLVYLIGEFRTGLEGLETAFKGISCASDGCRSGVAGNGCGNGTCTRGTHGNTCDGSSGGVCGCTSVVSCTGVLPVLYRYGFGYGNVEALHDTAGGTPKKCDAFLTTLKGVLKGEHIKHNGSGLHHEINKLIYTTRLPWIFVLTLAWLVAVLYLAFGAIWPLDWTHMRSHCRGWFRKGSLSPWEVLMVGKKKGRGILEFFGKEGKGVVGSTTSGYRWVKWLMVIIGTVAVFGGPLVAALVQNNDAWKIPLAVLLGIGGGALLVAVMVKAVVGAK